MPPSTEFQRTDKVSHAETKTVLWGVLWYVDFSKKRSCFLVTQCFLEFPLPFHLYRNMGIAVSVQFSLTAVILFRDGRFASLEGISKHGC